MLRSRCSVGLLGLLGLAMVGWMLHGQTFVAPPKVEHTKHAKHMAGLTALSLAWPTDAFAQDFGGGLITPRGDLFADSEAVLNMRENPPFFSQWPVWQQIAVPTALLLVVAAAAPLMMGDMIDQATIRRAKRREKEKKALIAMLKRQVAATAAAEAAEKAEKAAAAEKPAEA